MALAIVLSGISQVMQLVNRTGCNAREIRLSGNEARLVCRTTDLEYRLDCIRYRSEFFSLLRFRLMESRAEKSILKKPATFVDLLITPGSLIADDHKSLQHFLQFGFKRPLDEFILKG